jgi:hypothetical protein
MKRFFEGLKNLICLVCFLGEVILLILIAEIILKNQGLGMLILCFIACEFILKMFGFNSLVKTCLSLLEKK